MSNVMMLFVVGVVLVAVLGVMLGIMPYLVKKGMPVGKALDVASGTIDKADKVLDVVKEIVPANPVVNLLSIIEKAAKIGVGNAEQLYHAGDISKDDRATTAENIVLNVLKEIGITPDDNKKALIDAAIKEAVNALGHAPADVKAQQEAQAQLQQANSQLQAENDQLKQTISSIQATVQTVAATTNMTDTTVQAAM